MASGGRTAIQQGIGPVVPAFTVLLSYEDLTSHGAIFPSPVVISLLPLTERLGYRPGTMGAPESAIRIGEDRVSLQVLGHKPRLSQPTRETRCEQLRLFISTLPSLHRQTR